MNKELYRLKRPIEYGQQCIEELELREMEWGDIENLGDASMNMSALIDLVAKLSGQPPSVIQKLKMEDVLPLVAIVKKFMPASL